MRITPRPMLARNVLLNLVGQAVPLVVAVVALPFTLHGLGAERFGILTLAWTVLGTFSLLDLGLGRATARAVAQMNGVDDPRLARVLKTALLLQAGLGALAGIALFAVAPWVARVLFHVPDGLLSETTASIAVVAGAIPVVVVASGLRGALEGTQRFDLVHVVNVPATALGYALPAALVPFGASLPTILTAVVAVKALAAALYLVLARNVLGLAWWRAPFDRAEIAGLASFGGWVAAANVIGPLMMSVDRFLISAFLTVGAVAAYAAPYEVVTKLWLVPTSISLALFPAVSASVASDEDATVLARSCRALVLLLAPPVALAVVFAAPLVDVWMGSDFLAESPSVLRLLAVGVLLNSLGWIPYAYLMGRGRPDLQTKIILVQAPFLVALGAVMVRAYGVVGMAAATATMFSLYTVLAFGAMRRVFGISPAAVLAPTIGPWAAVAGFTAVVALVAVVVGPWWAEVALTAAAVAAFAVVVWAWVLDSTEKEKIIGAVGIGLSKAAATKEVVL